MRKNIQTKLHNPPSVKGNCFATVVSCFLDCEIEDVPAVEELMPHDGTMDSAWVKVMMNFLNERGWEWGSMNNHFEAHEHEFYIVVGTSPRNVRVNHCCIYCNGELWHDPHPDQTGLLDEKYFEYLIKSKSIEK